MSDVPTTPPIDDPAPLDRKIYAAGKSQRMSLRDLIGNFRRHGLIASPICI